MSFLLTIIRRKSLSSSSFPVSVSIFEIAWRDFSFFQGGLSEEESQLALLQKGKKDLQGNRILRQDTFALFLSQRQFKIELAPVMVFPLALVAPDGIGRALGCTARMGVLLEVVDTAP